MQDEAFQLWLTEWASLYDEGSKGKEVIQGIVDNWYLVSLVENDYVNGNIFQSFV